MTPPAVAGLEAEARQARSRMLAAGPVLVLAVSLVLTAIAWRAVETAQRERSASEFDDHVHDVLSRLQGRMRDDEQVLRGGVGLFAASDDVTRDEWRRFVAALRHGENVPGIQGVGFARWIPRGDLPDHERQVRAEGFPEYAVRPVGPRDEYTAIVYLEPFEWRNQRAFGFDMWSEPVRRAAMARARDTGDAALSGRIVLVQETEKDRQAGVLLYLPVYRRGALTNTVEARRQALVGWVYSPIRMKDFVMGAVVRPPAGLAFEIEALGGAGPGGLLFDSRALEPEPLPGEAHPDHEVVERLELLGQAWEVRFRSQPAPGGPFGRVGLVVLVGGLLASALLFAVTLVLARSRARALQLARALHEGELRYRTIFDSGPDGVVVLDPATAGFVNFNDQACRQLGYTREEFARLTLADVDATESPAETARRTAGVLAAGEAEFEVVHRDKVGRLRDVHVIARHLPVAGRPVFLCIWRDVTDQKRAEEARRREEARFHSYFDLPLVGAAITSPDKGWITVNDRLCAMLGYGREELRQHTWSDLTHPDDLPAEARLVAEVLAGGRDGYTLEKRLLRKDGEVLWASVAIQCVRGRDGAVEYFAGLLDDITARKREEQLAEARLRLVDKALSCSLGELLTFTLDEVEALTGSRIGFYHFVHDDGLELTLQAWSTRTARELCTAEEGHGIHYPVAQAGVWADCVRERRPVIHNDYASLPGKKGLPPGHAEVVRELAVPVVREGRIVAVLGTGNKATEYTEADVAVVTRFADLAWDVAERTLVQERLRESDARFAAAFDRAPMMMTLSRLEDGRYLGANQRFLEVSGFTREEVIGRTSVELGWISAEERRRLVEVIQADGRAAGLELALRARDGRAITARFWGEIIAVGGQQCLLSIAQDVTREQALQRQLAQAQKLESVGRLAGGVAHDFNNMLSVIQGHADLLLRETDPAAPIHEDLVEIRDAARRAAVVTRQLLAFARKQTVEPRVLDLNETVAGILKMLRRLIGEDIDLQWRPGFEVRRTRIDPSQVDQLLANLCVNSRDAIAGVGRVSIQTANVSLDEPFCARHGGLAPGDYVRLSVSDDGSGIPPEALPHIFEPFYTTKEIGRGTGLGLATVYGIVSQNGGAIEVESAPGQGATFHLYLPAVVEAAAATAAPEPAAAAPRGSETVLLVEDEPAVLKLCAGMLEHLGYRVISAAGPTEAVRLAAQHAGRVDLLMTDVVMPDVSGRDLATMLTLGHPGLRCLFMSGYTSETVDRHGVDGAAGVFLQKPFTPEELAVKVREALARHPVVAAV